MNAANWLEVSLIVDGEAAEAVADVLARYAPNGVVIEATGIEQKPNEIEGRPTGPLRVAAYLPLDERTDELRGQVERALWYLGRIRPLPEPHFREIEEADWSLAWREHYRPIPVGRQLIILPAWLEIPVSGRLPILIDPGMAFGTGTHPSTRLCLELLEDPLVAARLPGADIIDVGCGSGILSVAALGLGARHALGVDIDPKAVEVARQNASLNDVAESLDLGAGSVKEILSGAYSISAAPVVFANILAVIILRLLEAGLCDLVAPDGILILSGILDEQEPEVLAALQRHGFRVVGRRLEADWVALLSLRIPAEN
jgi:ribosomal protein L11 methyltransferase